MAVLRWLRSAGWVLTLTRTCISAMLKQSPSRKATFDNGVYSILLRTVLAAGGKVAEKEQRTSRSGKWDKKTTSATTIEQQAETNEGGAISVSEKAVNEEMSLDIGFPQFG